MSLIICKYFRKNKSGKYKLLLKLQLFVFLITLGLCSSVKMYEGTCKNISHCKITRINFLVVIHMLTNSNSFLSFSNQSKLI